MEQLSPVEGEIGIYEQDGEEGRGKAQKVRYMGVVIVHVVVVVVFPFDFL